MRRFRFTSSLPRTDYLSELHAEKRVTVIALGGQPSVMNAEYFIDEIKAGRTSPRRSFYLYSIVDFDPSGWIIRDAFLDNLRRYANMKYLREEREGKTVIYGLEAEAASTAKIDAKLT